MDFQNDQQQSMDDQQHVFDQQNIDQQNMDEQNTMGQEYIVDYNFDTEGHNTMNGI